MLANTSSAGARTPTRQDNRVDETAPGVRGVRRIVLTAGARILNPPMRRLAGTRRFPLFAIVRHRGRRSGRDYATPVAARPTPDGFVIPLTFGAGADWFRNVRATGGCVVRWKGAEYAVVEPEIVALADARSVFSPLERRLLPLIGIERFVRLRRAPAASDASSDAPRR